MTRRMQWTGLSLAVALALGWGAGLLDAGQGHQTRASGEARYAIAQTAVKPELTLRLDKFSGQTYFLRTESDQPEWESIRWTERRGENATLREGVNYQLVAFGQPGVNTLLVNVNTGRSWFLDFDSGQQKPVWREVEEDRTTARLYNPLRRAVQ